MSSWTPLSDHWRRFVMTIRGEWRTEYQLGRKSKLKFYPFEVSHAAKNLAVEALRQWGVWNRGDKRPEDDLGYSFPEE